MRYGTDCLKSTKIFETNNIYINNMNKYIPLAFSFLLPLSSCSDADDLREEADLAVKEMAGIRSFSDETLDANGTKMSVSGEDGHLSAIFSMGGKRYLSIDKNNVVIEVFKRGTDESKTYQSEYTTIEKVDESLKCTALITTDGGSEFETTDIYSRNTENGSIRMNRTVKVKKVAAVDYSFNSYYLLGEENGQSKTSYEYFLPSLIYKDNTNMTDASIGADLTDSWILAREERTALPLTMMRNKATGNTISITDYNLNPATTSADWGMSHLVDSRMKYGSIGYCMTGNTPQLAYCYPGSEGEHSYSDGGGTADKRWARWSALSIFVMYHPSLHDDQALRTSFILPVR